MEFGGDPQKIDEYFHWGRIFYVCSSARNWLSFMYKSIYHLCNSLWGVATLDVWSSSTRTCQQKKRAPRSDQFLFILYLKNELFTLTEGYPHDWCHKTIKKTILQWKPMEFGGDPENMMNMFTGDLYSMYVVLQGIGSLPFQGIYHICNSLWGVATLDVWSS